MAVVLLGAGPVQTVQGKGLHFLPSPIISPLAGMGHRGRYQTLRIFLDDGYTQVVVDRAAASLLIDNRHVYQQTKIIADVATLGYGTTAAGGRAYFVVHLKLKKTGDELDVDAHVHPTSKEELSLVQFPALDIHYRGANSTVSLLSAAAARQLAVEGGGGGISGLFVEVEDNLQGKPLLMVAGPTVLADLSVGLGISLATKMVLNARLTGLNGAAGLPETLKRGGWALRLESLSSLLPDDLVKRHLSLLGLAAQPLLAPVMQRGLQSGEVIVLSMVEGGGWLEFAGQRTPIVGTRDKLRHYLEFDFLGSLLLRSARSR